jgi:signal peptidase I
MKAHPLTALIIIAFSLGCAAVAGDTIVFHGTSMLPGIRDGDRLAVERFDRGNGFEGKRGDVIAFLYPEDASKYYVKRLVGLPGETVEIREGAVFINGSRLEEPYVDPKFNMSRASHTPVRVEEQYYYVLGDNRDASSDSRIWGLVPGENIYARVVSDDNSTRKSR